MRFHVSWSALYTQNKAEEGIFPKANKASNVEFKNQAGFSVITPPVFADQFILSIKSGQSMLSLKSAK